MLSHMVYWQAGVYSSSPSSPSPSRSGSFGLIGYFACAFICLKSDTQEPFSSTHVFGTHVSRTDKLNIWKGETRAVDTYYHLRGRMHDVRYSVNPVFSVHDRP